VESAIYTTSTGKRSLTYNAHAREGNEVFLSHSRSILDPFYYQVERRVHYGSEAKVLSIFDLDSIQFVTMA
jgi:hypothetical protein